MYFITLKLDLGATALYKKVKSQGINLKQIKEGLSKQNVTQQTKKTTSKLQSFIPSKPLYQFQVDLIVLLKKKHHIKKKINIHYALTCIDIFTKKADIQYLGQSKTGRVVADAMDKIINNLGVPETIFSDDGSEFIAVEFQNLMEKHKIMHRFTHLHASFIESFHKTLKNKLHKYLQSIEKDGIQAILAALPKI